MSDKTNMLSNFSKICRTCLGEGVTKPLYDCKTEECLVEMLMSCTFIQISKGDGLPEQICTQCIKHLNFSYKFSKQCEQSDIFLRKYLREYTGSSKPKANMKIKSTDTDNPVLKQEQFFEQLTEVNFTERSSVNTELQSALHFENENKVIVQDENQINAAFIASKSSGNDLDEIPPMERMSSTSSITEMQQNVSMLENNCKVPKSFDTKVKVKSRRHNKTNLKRDSKCHICSKMFPKYELMIHMRSHSKERPFMCETCGQQFSIKCNLERHLLTHTGIKPHRCHLCPKAFIQKTSLLDHIRLHNNEKHFMCSTCGKMFRQAVQLRVHKRQHECEKGEKQKYECSICHRSFLLKSVLKTHLLIHEEKQFSCDICGKLFTYKRGLQSHSRTHTGLKPYTCNVCGKPNAHLAGLRTHMLVHTKEKRFICEICERAFAQRNHLQSHLRTHTGVKPYACDMCEKHFASKASLTVHKRIHLGVKPFSCDICQKMFYDSGSMRKHRKTHIQ